MFAELEAKLAQIEQKLFGFLGSAKGQITALRAQLDALGRTVTAPVDRVAAKVTGTEQKIKTDVAALRREVEQLAPPP